MINFIKVGKFVTINNFIVVAIAIAIIEVFAIINSILNYLVKD